MFLFDYVVWQIRDHLISSVHSATHFLCLITHYCTIAVQIVDVGVTTEVCSHTDLMQQLLVVYLCQDMLMPLNPLSLLSHCLDYMTCHRSKLYNWSWLLSERLLKEWTEIKKENKHKEHTHFNISSNPEQSEWSVERKSKQHKQGFKQRASPPVICT